MIGSTSMINKYAGMFGVQKNPTTPPIGKADASGNSGFNADLLTLSPTANMLQQFLSMDVQGHNERGEIDLTGLEQLKQRGEMLSNILQMKLKNFESNLISSMKSAGLNPSQDMDLKNGDDGLLMMNDGPNQASIQNFLNSNAKGKLGEQFQEIVRLATLLNTVQQSSSQGISPNIPQNGAAGAYAQQSQPLKLPGRSQDGEFVMRVQEGTASYAFE